ncbi:MAG TPA: hypothetical protein DCE42_16605 [Myxococcales bacterium]|nr:hypothetical protein [Deltaproteobacteria bacterium]MBU47283.1 hypothetical protein [Deltaproteobacteria bacterium]HAA56388.1 hypothetical protein [Myxococcales bacterium]|tara:strand:+ start:11807 stop:12439 length:633 start_codon:yes stop_codon:yes gene_type:complete
MMHSQDSFVEQNGNNSWDEGIFQELDQNDWGEIVWSDNLSLSGEEEQTLWSEPAEWVEATEHMSFEDEDEDDWDDECTEYEEATIYAPRASSKGNLLFWSGIALCLTILASAALVDIWAQGEATRLGFTYSKSVQELERVRVERKRLKIRLAALRNPARLVKIARQELGLRQPTRSQLISEKQVREQIEFKKQDRIRIARRPQLLPVVAQ